MRQVDSERLLPWVWVLGKQEVTLSLQWCGRQVLVLTFWVLLLVFHGYGRWNREEVAPRCQDCFLCSSWRCFPLDGWASFLEAYDASYSLPLSLIQGPLSTCVTPALQIGQH